MSGIVYIVKNPAFPHLFKIGRTSKKSVEERGLNASNVPEDYETLHAYECEDDVEVERYIHSQLDNVRHKTSKGRLTEFFYIGYLEKANDILRRHKGTKEITENFNDIVETHQYTEEYHLKDKPENILKLYNKLKKYLLSLNPKLSMSFRKYYMSFKLTKRIVSDIEIQNKQIKVYINTKKGTLKDIKNITRDISNTGTWGNGDYQVLISSEKQIPDVLDLIKQIL